MTISATSLGDLNGDGAIDLAVGAVGDATGGSGRGAVYILNLAPDSTAPTVTSIARQNPVTSPTDADLLTFRVTFDEDVQNVSADGTDFSITGPSGVTLSVSAVSASIYDVAVLTGNPLGDMPLIGVSESYTVTNGPQPAEVSLPDDGGSYELLRDGVELVLQVAGGAELLRREAALVSVLTINGSADADIVTVLDSGTVVSTPIKFFGFDGEDSFNGTEATGALYLHGGPGNDSLLGGSAGDTLVGGTGNDTLDGGAGDDRLSGAQDDDSLLGRSGLDSLFGDAGDDVIQGGADRDFIRGGNGADNILGDAANDTIAGNAGNDTITGGSGSDSLTGGDDDDRLFGFRGSDTLNGSAGNDRLEV